MQIWLPVATLYCGTEDRSVPRSKAWAAVGCCNNQCVLTVCTFFLGSKCCEEIGCRVRIALGLKPLALENDADVRRKEALAREAQRAEEAKQAKAAELAERVKACAPLL